MSQISVCHAPLIRRLSGAAVYAVTAILKQLAKRLKTRKQHVKGSPLPPAPGERKLELQVPLTTQLHVERKKMLNNRIGRGKGAPLIFRACREVAAKGIFRISLLVRVLLN